ncbi:type VII secretion protein EccCa [Pseudosporangium ferrugineum]|uniref:S-DNA-T family DNA segregation ATPase FtsK/SpoIIIE n=1 Tax=Pseudosporangium ferrugineum TaxID=439699 RepID=A0A2T0SEU6_9ACTN|nr:type VII secretion protein EccCa [Pseudosporangium ferrugineum]PRY31937.1 S-DNA-T family DNA segregation ATPase FtsK/SpoIIIE [Pseudosporangium ferrugineum]
MSGERFTHGPGTPAVARPPAEIVLQPPPAIPRSGGTRGAQQLMFMLPMMIGMGAMSFVYIGRSSGIGTVVFGGLFVIVMGGMLVMTLSGGRMAKKAQINDERRDYLRYLAGLRDAVRQAAARQREGMLEALPAPGDLWTLAGTPRMWRRRVTDPGFGRVRVGLGPQRLATALRPPQTAPLEELDPVSSTSLKRFLRAYAVVDDLPVAVSLRAFTRIAIGGEPVGARDLARAVVAHLAALHAPDDLRIAVCVDDAGASAWDWVKWLPHAAHPVRADATGPLRLFAGGTRDLAGLVAGDLAGRPRFQPGAGAPAGMVHLVVVRDLAGGAAAGTAPGEGLAGVTVVDVGGAGDRSATVLGLVVADGRLGVRRPEGTVLAGVPDGLDPVTAEAVARQFAPWHRRAPAGNGAGATGPAELAGLLGIGEPRDLDVAQTWRPRPAGDRLRVPLGTDLHGEPVLLDLKESAEGGMGPHGLVIGATGSGKSELLRTLVTGLVTTHSSETLNLALVDFKGGATFTGMADLPHTCAVITNLAAELTLVDRMGDALRGEMVRRQELLRAAGNYASVRDYEKARQAGADLAPVPSLLVIIDEFSELLSSRPEFIELFVMIGRLGRSLAIHLLLASQRLEEGRLRGLDSHLSYRIGLRTFSAAESRTVLGVPDAYELPGEPGAGYLKMDTTTLRRFRAAYVSGPVGSPRRGPKGPGRREPEPVPFTARAVAAAGPPPVAPSALDATGPSTMEVLLGRLGGRGPAAHRIWLPPLAEPPTIDELLPPLGADERRGLCPAGWDGNGRLTVPVAVVDKPFEQRRDVLWADLSGAAGNAVVVGAPQSGKSTLLRTLVCALSLTHTPREVQFFLMDMGGGALSTLSGLPHVSGVAGRLDAERCRRIVAELDCLLTEREALFQEHGIDSMAAFRRDPPAGADGRVFGDVFLVIDGWMTLRQEYEALSETISSLAARGLGYGIHVVLSVSRWMELRPALRDMIGTQFELRLGDPSDSAVDRRAAAAVPTAAGRGVTRDKLHFLAALPRLDHSRSGDDVAAGIADLARRVARAWPGGRAPQVRLLPRLLPAAQLPAADGSRPVPIGIAEADLRPIALDFDADPHLIVFGDNESGKSGLLRLLASGLTDRYAPAEAAILVVDYRRSLLDVVTGEHLLAYAGSEPTLTATIGDVAKGMRDRLPGPGVTSEELRRRSWWTGPELFILVDDYDLVAGPGGNPLLALADLLPHSRDIGLHLLVARRSGGAGRALYEPVLQRLRELGTPGILLSGAKDEGALLGGLKPSPRPPGQGQYVGRRGDASVLQVAWGG